MSLPIQKRKPNETSNTPSKKLSTTATKYDIKDFFSFADDSILGRIFLHLPLITRLELPKVCKRFNKLMNLPFQWRINSILAFSIFPYKTFTRETFKEAYALKKNLIMIQTKQKDILMSIFLCLPFKQFLAMRTLNKEFMHFIDNHNDAWKTWAERFQMINLQHSSNSSPLNWRSLIISRASMRRLCSALFKEAVWNTRTLVPANEEDEDDFYDEEVHCITSNQITTFSISGYDIVYATNLNKSERVHLGQLDAFNSNGKASAPFFCSYKSNRLIIANKQEMKFFTIDPAVFEDEELSLNLVHSIPLEMEYFENSSCKKGTTLQWKLEYHTIFDYAVSDNNVFIFSSREKHGFGKEFYITNAASERMTMIETKADPKFTTASHLDLLIVGTDHKQNEVVTLSLNVYSPTLESYALHPIYQKGAFLCLATVDNWLITSAEDSTLSAWDLKEKTFMYHTFPFSSPIVQIVPFDQSINGHTQGAHKGLHPLSLLVHDDFSLSLFQVSEKIVLTIFNKHLYMDPLSAFMESLPSKALLPSMDLSPSEDSSPEDLSPKALLPSEDLSPEELFLKKLLSAKVTLPPPIPLSARNLPVTTCGHTIRVGGNNCLTEFSFETKDDKVISEILENNPWTKKASEAPSK